MTSKFSVHEVAILIHQDMSEKFLINCVCTGGTRVIQFNRLLGVINVLFLKEGNLWAFFVTQCAVRGGNYFCLEVYIPCSIMICPN